MSSPNTDPDVIFATPCFGFKIEPTHKKSATQTEWLLAKHGISSGYMERNGDCFVAKARSKLVTDFLQQFPQTQNFFFIDDDVGWPPPKVIEFLMNPYPIVCGAYPKKSKEVDFPVTLASKNGELIKNEYGHCLAMLAPAGFMRIKRDVLERLVETCNTFTDLEPDGEIHTFSNIFEAGRAEDGRFWGEDYTFTRKVQILGYDIWCDPDIEFDHSGHFTWRDSLGAHLETFAERARELYAQQQAGTLDETLMINYPRVRDEPAVSISDERGEAAE